MLMFFSCSEIGKMEHFKTNKKVRNLKKQMINFKGTENEILLKNAYAVLLSCILPLLKQ